MPGTFRLAALPQPGPVWFPWGLKARLTPRSLGPFPLAFLAKVFKKALTHTWKVQSVAIPVWWHLTI